ncbi:MAG: hypothetical protein OJF47_004185 [Nitrospira sp.]|nr:MAG: hypothetical protein OJF47_004185 [Nitrospira sp.]
MPYETVGSYIAHQQSHERAPTGRPERPKSSRFSRREVRDGIS